MKKLEMYLWIVFIAAIAVAVVYSRFIYKPEVVMSLRFTSTPSNIFVYQNVVLPINVSNIGSIQIINMSVGIFVNNTLSGIYHVSLPRNTSATLNFSYTPKLPGKYNVTVMADPNNLYNLGNRKSASDTFILVANPVETPAAYSLLPDGPIVSRSMVMTNLGYVASSYLLNNYSMTQLGLSNISVANSLFYPLLNLTTPYLSDVAVASARYNNASALSLWISGYLKPNIVDVAAEGKGINFTNESVGGKSVSVMQLDSNTTLCSWYDGGWIKNFVYRGPLSCLSVLNRTIVQNKSQSNPLADKLNQLSQGVVENFSYAYGGNYIIGKMLVVNSSVMFASLQNFGIDNNRLCSGPITNINNASYCSYYVFPLSGMIGNFSLIKTLAFTKEYNSSVVALVNTSDVLNQVAYNIGALNQFNITGPYLNFSSGISNICKFGGGFECSSAKLINNSVMFTLVNKNNESVVLNSVGCIVQNATYYTNLTSVVEVGKSVNVTSGCGDLFSSSNPNSYVASIYLKFGLNYTIGGAHRFANGNVLIV
ncbi:MAG: hypothetical protein M1122_01155 [Candidatus Marsarchaeota archaeon]|nr:hypothetical protein [Candidatus Marsarchaeota archaeon]